MHPILVGVELVSIRVHMQTLIRVEMNSTPTVLYGSLVPGRR